VCGTGSCATYVVTEGHVTPLEVSLGCFLRLTSLPVTSLLVMSLPVAPPQMRLELSPYTTRVTRSLVFYVVFCRLLFVLFLLAVVLSVILRFTDSD